MIGVCISGILHILPRLIDLQFSRFRSFVIRERIKHASTLELSRLSSLGPARIPRRDVLFCRCRAIHRSIGRGGCSQALLFLLLLVILILSFSSSSSSPPSSPSSPHPFLSHLCETAFTKELSLSGIDPVTLRLKAQDSTSRPLGLLPLMCV